MRPCLRSISAIQPCRPSIRSCRLGSGDLALAVVALAAVGFVASSVAPSLVGASAVAGFAPLPFGCSLVFASERSASWPGPRPGRAA